MPVALGARQRGCELLLESLLFQKGQVSRRVERVQPSAQLGNPLLTVVAESSIVGRDPQVNGVDVCFRFSEAIERQRRRFK